MYYFVLIFSVGALGYGAYHFMKYGAHLTREEGALTLNPLRTAWQIKARHGWGALFESLWVLFVALLTIITLLRMGPDAFL